MRFALVAFGLGLFAQPLFGQAVEVGEGDWSNIPRLEKHGLAEMGSETMLKIEKIVRAGKCPAIGRKDRIRMNVPFIVEFKPDNSVNRVVVKRIGCPEVEQLAASIALNMVRYGHYRPTGTNPAGWYRGEVTYTLD